MQCVWWGLLWVASKDPLHAPFFLVLFKRTHALFLRAELKLFLRARPTLYMRLECDVQRESRGSSELIPTHCW